MSSNTSRRFAPAEDYDSDLDSDLEFGQTRYDDYESTAGRTGARRGSGNEHDSGSANCLIIGVVVFILALVSGCLMWWAVGGRGSAGVEQVEQKQGNGRRYNKHQSPSAPAAPVEEPQTVSVATPIPVGQPIPVAAPVPMAQPYYVRPARRTWVQRNPITFVVLIVLFILFFPTIIIFPCLCCYSVITI